MLELLISILFIPGIVRGLKRGTWIPVGSKSSLPSKTSIKILNEKYVIWENPINNEWSLGKDVCPHRLAPLSQGRVDDKTGCIECPYHGWQFSSSGKCTKLPQSKPKYKEQGKSLEMIPLMETGDIIWGCFPLNNGEFSKKPNQVFPELDDVHTVFTRELPYSFDFLVENFMDPAHIPFAHHGLQGVRSDGINIPMNVITQINDTEKIEIQFRDRIRGKMRDGIVSFTSPAYYHFRVKDDSGEYKIQLMVLITPVSVGLTRVHLAFIDNNLPNKLPKWISHSFSNTFLETDIWLHNCELEASRNNVEAIDSYHMPTTSDIGTRAWRKWWKKHLSNIPAFSSNLDKIVKVKELTPEEQKERIKSHIDGCIHCQNALKRSSLIRIFSVITLVFVNTRPLLSVFSFFFLNKLSQTIDEMILGNKSI